MRGRTVPDEPCARHVPSLLWPTIIISDVSAQYGKKSCSPGEEALHVPSVADAVRVLSCSSESLAGCAEDFAVLKSGDTCLVEVNDGVFTGQYDGVSDDDFAAMWFDWTQ